MAGREEQPSSQIDLGSVNEVEHIIELCVGNSQPATIPVPNLQPEAPLQASLNVTTAPSVPNMLHLFPLHPDLSNAQRNKQPATVPVPNLRHAIPLLPGLNVATPEEAPLLRLPTLQLNLDRAHVYNEVVMFLDPRPSNQQRQVPPRLALNPPGKNPRPRSPDVVLRPGQSISSPRSAFRPFQARSRHAPPAMAQEIGIGNASASAFRGNVNVPGANLKIAHGGSVSGATLRIAGGGSIHGGRPNDRQQPQPQPWQQQQQEANNAGLLMDQNSTRSNITNSESSPLPRNFSGSDFPPDVDSGSGPYKKQKR